jgi:hypothetical protein
MTEKAAFLILLLYEAFVWNRFRRSPDDWLPLP